MFAGLNTGKLLKSTFANFNPIWTDISSTEFVGSISDIAFGQNEQEIFVTMHNYGVTSVWFTSDGGTNWLNKEGDLPDLPVKCILQNPLIPNEVIIGTELGVWATPDISVASPIWVQVVNGMRDVTVVDLDLKASDNTILASTHGRGMFTGQFTSVALSINDNSIISNNITVYPTISNGEITIKTSQNLGDVQFKVFNINGQKVYSSELELSNNTQQVNLNLSSGMYFAQFTVDNVSETKKIIIK